MLVKFLDYQQKYILDESKIVLAEKGRQEGFTWVSGYKIPRRIFRSRTPQNHYWISRDEFTAKQFVVDCLTWVQVFNIVAETEVIDIAKDVQATKIKFPNGSNLFVLSSSVDAVVGKRGHFYIDEAAIHKDFEQLWNIALPCINWGFTITVISTHRSKKKYFYKLCEKARNGELKGASLHTVTIQDAIADGLVDQMNIRLMLAGMPKTTPEEFLADCRANCSTEEIFLQEYMCVPADSESSEAVKEEELKAVMRSKDELFIPHVTGRYFMGVDIGRHRDLTVIWILEDVSTPTEPMLKTRYIKTMSMAEFTVQEKEIAKAVQLWKPRACFIDGTNTGAMLAENLSKKFSCCESIKITAATRPQFIGDAVGMIRREVVQVPETNDVFEDFLSVERYINKYGNVDYFIPSKAGRGHGDRFMSFTLAIQAFKSKKSLAAYILKNEGEGKSETPKTENKTPKSNGFTNRNFSFKRKKFRY